MNGEKISTIWPGWKITRTIGRGSFGSVYEMERVQFGKTEKAAVKMLTIPQDESMIDELYSDGYDDESISQRMQGELQEIVKEYYLMAELKGHTNVVNCDDMQYRERENGPGWDVFIKMELLTPLHKVFGKGSGETVSDESVAKLGKDICQALILCEKKNIVHRDIKPQNILRSEFGEYKLGDFGIAKTMEHTTSGTKTGTYKYMAPEVYCNRPYGHGTDIYSLGLVMYWLLNENRMPFLPLPPTIPTTSMEDAARTKRFRGEKIPEPKNGSSAIKAVILKACAYEPKERFASARDMLNALETLSGASENRIDNSCLQKEESKKEKSNLVWSDWRITRIIGRGSFGSVYEIERIQSEKTEKAAMRVSTIPEYEGLVDEMYNEGYDKESITKVFQDNLQDSIDTYELVAELKGHPNILAYDDMQYRKHEGSLGWDIYIKMELLSPLTTVFRNERMISDETVIKLGKDICRALILCERKKIVHRDIKYNNIYISENRTFKLGGFDLAKKMENSSIGTVVGTPEYMAPEVVQHRPYGHSVDIYSLGLMMYYLLNENRMPFLPLPPAVLTSFMRNEANMKRCRGEKIPEPKNGSSALKAVVLKACAYEPKERFASAGDMLNALETLSGVTENICRTVYREKEYDNTVGNTVKNDFSGTGTIFDDFVSAENEDTMGNSWTDRFETIGVAPYVRTQASREEEKTVGVNTPATKKSASPKTAADSRELPPGVLDYGMDWKDDVLDEKMRNITGIHDDPIMLSDVYYLTSLDFLKELYLYWDEEGKTSCIRNYEALSDLKQLRELKVDVGVGEDIRRSVIQLLKELPNIKRIGGSMFTLGLDPKPMFDASGLTGLTYVLYNSKLKFLRYMPQLEMLHLRAGNLEPAFGSKKIRERILGLRKLEDLGLDSVGISDITFLSSITRLKALRLSRNEIKDITPLRYLIGLEALDLHEDQISDISSLRYLSKLSELRIGGAMIQDANVLSELPQLRYLSIAWTEVADFSFLASLSKLECLWIASDKIKSVPFLRSMSKLRYLKLCGDQISSLSGLENLLNLELVVISSPMLQDVSVLGTLPNLRLIYVSEECSEPVRQQCKEIIKQKNKAQIFHESKEVFGDKFRELFEFGDYGTRYVYRHFTSF